MNFIKTFFRKIINFMSKNDYSIIGKIRYATVDDAIFIKTCIEKGHDEKHFHGEKFTRTSIEEIIKQNGYRGQFFIIENHNEEKAETAFCGKPAREYGSKHEINMLYILEPFRRTGLATCFIKYYETIILNTKIFVRCDKKHSIEAIRLFEKLGYQKSPKEKVDGKHTFVVLEKN